MKARRRIVDDQLYVHFITFSVYRRRRLLDHDQAKRILLGYFNEVLEQYQSKCVGFVVMPDHVHALVWFPKPGQLSAFRHSWKRRSSIGLRGWYRQIAPEYSKQFGEGDRFWQPKYYAFEIDEQRKLEEKLNYMHLNPVRAGLVEEATDWKWSSARWYERQCSVGVPIEWIQ
jgi:putative transposase